jgi:hypothetical protein
VKYKIFIPVLASLSAPLFATSNHVLAEELTQLQRQTRELQIQINHLQKQLNTKKVHNASIVKKTINEKQPKKMLSHLSPVSVRLPNDEAAPAAYYPKGLIADGKVITYIAGTPVVRSLYTGSRQAFDGSDYLINISSINRDIRLMEQRRKLYNIYQGLGYPAPDRPIIALSGKVEPIVTANRPYRGHSQGDINLGSAELDVAAILNENVEGFISIAYDESPPADGGPRVSNSEFDLNLGFINIGNLERTPLYLTAGQLYAPYGRYSSAMVSAPLTMRLARNKTRPIIIGYKSQAEQGPFAAIYGFKSDTTYGKSGNGGINLGYMYGNGYFSGEVGASYVYSIADADGMQLTFYGNRDNFGGFGSFRGSELVKQVPGMDAYGILRFDRYNLTAEWVGAINNFRAQDLSFNGSGARPSAGQLEAGATFKVFDKPASVGLGYQWSKDSLALGLPTQRYSGVFNISLWKDTVESLEYRHDIDFKQDQYGNGASRPGTINVPIIGTGGSSDTLLAQIGVYF